MSKKSSGMQKNIFRPLFHQHQFPNEIFQNRSVCTWGQNLEFQKFVKPHMNTKLEYDLKNNIDHIDMCAERVHDYNEEGRAKEESVVHA